MFRSRLASKSLLDQGSQQKIPSQNCFHQRCSYYNHSGGSDYPYSMYPSDGTDMETHINPVFTFSRRRNVSDRYIIVNQSSMINNKRQDPAHQVISVLTVTVMRLTFLIQRVHIPSTEKRFDLAVKAVMLSVIELDMAIICSKVPHVQYYIIAVFFPLTGLLHRRSESTCNTLGDIWQMALTAHNPRRKSRHAAL